MARELSLVETGALILSLLFVGLSFGGSSPLVSALLELRGRSEYFTGAVVAMLSVGLALFSPLAGRLVDRVGARLVNVSGLVAQGLGFAGLGLALAVDDRLLLVARLWLGIAAAFTFVAAEFALLQGTPASRRGRVMAAYGAAFGLGFMIGVFASNRAFDALGLASFPLLGLVGFAIAPLAFWSLRGQSEPSAPESGKLARAASVPWRGLLLALYGALVYAVLDIAMTGTYPVEAQRLGLSRREALDLVGWMAFGTVAIQPLAGALSDRFGNRRVLLVLSAIGAMASAAAGIVSWRGLAQSMFSATLCFTAVGAAVGGVFPVSLALLGERTPPALLSRANAAFSAVFGYASLTGPILAAGFIDLAERVELLGWAVPGLALLTFALGLPLGLADRRWRRRKLSAPA